MSANPPRFRNRSENEFAGCRAALDSLHQQDPGTLSIGLILHRHRLLFSFVGGGGGRFKLDDNLVTNRHDDGTTTTRFAPVTAAETEYYVTELVDRTNDALAAGVVHPVLITAAFRFDLLCIHPFADDNGRVARLMTTYLMSRSGYGVGRYVSLEQVIYETKDDYYAALGASTTGWFDDGAHDVWPWASSFLGCVADAYEGSPTGSRQAPMVERNRTGFATSCGSTPWQRFRSRTISGWCSAVEVGGLTGSRGGCFGRRPLDASVRLRLNALL